MVIILSLSYILQKYKKYGYLGEIANNFVNLRVN
jgi:hypothetical protein